jgi:hypothetical protein
MADDGAILKPVVEQGYFPVRFLMRSLGRPCYQKARVLSGTNPDSMD